MLIDRPVHRALMPAVAPICAPNSTLVDAGRAGTTLGPVAGNEC
jgi:hypothetical protein